MGTVISVFIREAQRLQSDSRIAWKHYYFRITNTL